MSGRSSIWMKFNVSAAECAERALHVLPNSCHGVFFKAWIFLIKTPNRSDSSVVLNYMILKSLHASLSSH